MTKRRHTSPQAFDLDRYVDSIESVRVILATKFPRYPVEERGYKLPEHLLKGNAGEPLLYEAAKFARLFVNGAGSFTHDNYWRDLKVLWRMDQRLGMMADDLRELSSPTKRELDRTILRDANIDHYSWFMMIVILREKILAVQDFARDGLSSDQARILYSERSRKYPPDWDAAAVAAYARVVWEKGSGKKAPRFVHAQTLAPFGEFLTDILEALTDGLRPGAAPPGAGSATRALREITSRGIKFRGY